MTPKRKRHEIRQDMRVRGRKRAEGIVTKPVTPIEDLAGVDAGKIRLEKMRKKLDELRSRDRY